MLLHRVLTALVGIPIVLAAIWFGPPWLTLLAAAAAAIGVREAYRLNATNVTDTANNQPEGDDETAPTALPALLGALWAVALVLAGELAAAPGDFTISAAAVCAAGSIAAGLWMIAAWRGRRPAVAATYLIIAPVYVGGALACALAVRDIGPMPQAHDPIANPGLWWLLLAILTVYAADTAAYTVGRLLGRHPMAPNVSPAKTWEGAAAGLVGAAIAAAALAMLTPLTLQLWQAAVIGVIVGIVAPLGDLLESQAKRWAGAKDSGALFPGHGGMLDRLDSLLPSFIVIYIVAAYSANAN